MRREKRKREFETPVEGGSEPQKMPQRHEFRAILTRAIFYRSFNMKHKEFRTQLKRALMWLHGHCLLPDRVVEYFFRRFSLAAL